MKVTLGCFSADPVRLVSEFGGVGGSVGRLEIFVDNSWGSVCDNSFDKATADVACRQLGFLNGSVSFSNAGKLRYVESV
jgi:hypothetical protein